MAIEIKSLDREGVKELTRPSAPDQERFNELVKALPELDTRLAQGGGWYISDWQDEFPSKSPRAMATSLTRAALRLGLDKLTARTVKGSKAVAVIVKNGDG